MTIIKQGYYCLTIVEFNAPWLTIDLLWSTMLNTLVNLVVDGLVYISGIYSISPWLTNQCWSWITSFTIHFLLCDTIFECPSPLSTMVDYGFHSWHLLTIVNYHWTWLIKYDHIKAWVIIVWPWFILMTCGWLYLNMVDTITPSLT